MSEVRPLAGGPPVPSLQLVQTDQITILGDGSHGDPLRDASGTPFVASFVPDNPLSPILGMIVTATTSPPDPGVSYAVRPAGAASGGHPFAVGMITKISVGDVAPRVTVRSSGIVTLTIAEWNALTGGSGGLIAGDAYFLSAVQLGGITTFAPGGSGAFVAQIGVALSATAMVLSMPAAAKANP